MVRSTSSLSSSRTLRACSRASPEVIVPRRSRIRCFPSLSSWRVCRKASSVAKMSSSFHFSSAGISARVGSLPICFTPVLRLSHTTSPHPESLLPWTTQKQDQHRLWRNTRGEVTPMSMAEVLALDIGTRKIAGLLVAAAEEGFELKEAIVEQQLPGAMADGQIHHIDAV